MCSLRFDIEENINIEAFATLRFASITFTFAFGTCLHVYTIEACAVPGGIYTTGACSANGRVCTTEECTAPGVVYTTGA
jgi:hypothetical protein